MKIVLTGPECVGKSTLSGQLAHIYKGDHVKEFAREYVENLKRPYRYNDVVAIAKQQLKEYDDRTDRARYCFFDTYLIVTKVWFMQVFNKLPGWFEEELAKRPVDFYLLLKNDITWQPDGVRENKDKRTFLFNLYKTELERYGYAYKIIEGKGEKRLTNAFEAIEERFKKIII
ncbi:Nicotinamide riboside kinase [Saccharicrinis carchari]|uniref:Nicotinamide riboside kinase n=1 Tax=Saccharicrinis carchari TaxID=1168039 RepID=A0A521E279_SACCC|nr:AAA family ATPase [Saccharicrinis carchari]SMO77411.1 Nicotinamide riboside kinase [Saccharicrinis carchari]